MKLKPETRIRRACNRAIKDGYKITQGEWGVMLDIAQRYKVIAASPTKLLCPLGALILGGHIPDLDFASAAARKLGVSVSWVNEFGVTFDGGVDSLLPNEAATVAKLMIEEYIK